MTRWYLFQGSALTWDVLVIFCGYIRAHLYVNKCLKEPKIKIKKYELISLVRNLEWGTVLLSSHVIGRETVGSRSFPMQQLISGSSSKKQGGRRGVGAVAKKILLLEEPQIKCRIIWWSGLTSAVQGQRGREGNPNIQESIGDIYIEWWGSGGKTPQACVFYVYNWYVHQMIGLKISPFHIQMMKVYAFICSF